MSLPTEKVSYSNNLLYKVPIIEQGSGFEHSVYVDPARVNNLHVINISVRDPKINSNETRQVEVTAFFSGRIFYTTRLTIRELAELLELGLVEQKATGANG